MPIRVLGNVAAFGFAMAMPAKMGESMAHSIRTVPELLAEARVYLVEADDIKRVLGSNNTLGTPVSFSSSGSSDANGKNTLQTKIIIPVEGSLASGDATLIVQDESIESLELQTENSTIAVSLKQ